MFKGFEQMRIFLNQVNFFITNHFNGLISEAYKVNKLNSNDYFQLW